MCKITQTKCPYTYFCDRLNTWRLSKYAPNNCPVEQKQKKPKEGYKVLFERHGYLYVSIDNQAISIKNPFNEIPLYVKVIKKDGKYEILE